MVRRDFWRAFAVVAAVAAGAEAAIFASLALLGVRFSAGVCATACAPAVAGASSFLLGAAIERRFRS